MVFLAPLAVTVAASCGGSAFSTGGGGDGGSDSTSPADGSDDPVIVVEASSGGGETSSGGEASSGGDASTDVVALDAPASIDSAAQDSHADVVEEPPPPTCGGSFTCVPAVPTGWAGPVELYAGSSPAPACTADFDSFYDGNAQLNAPAASCTCSCNAPTTQCTAPALSFFATGVCSGVPSCYTTTLQNGVCTTINDSASCPTTLGTPHMTAPASAIVSASCMADPGKQITMATWGTYAQACFSATTVAQVDCQAGSVCAPKPSAPYGQTLCISQAGDFSCPAQGYTSKQLFYGGVDDSRDCSACTCGGLSGASCAASFVAFLTSDGSCGGGTGDSYAAPFTCNPVTQPADFRLTLTPQNGSCGANPVTSTGTATPTGPTTFCCLP